LRKLRGNYTHIKQCILDPTSKEKASHSHT
jgi:hypothetical protein